MSPHKLPEPTPKGTIADRSAARSLVSGSGYLNPGAPYEQRSYGQLQWVRDFWEEHAPELAHFRGQFFEDDDMTSSEIRRWRHNQHQRVRYLLLHDLLAGEALEEAQKMKRQHELYEWGDHR